MRLVLLAAALAAAVSACATTTAPKEKAAAVEYKVIKTDVRVPFAGSTIRGFQVADDDSLILDGGSRWYRATLWEPCQRDLDFESVIALVSAPTDTLDRFSRVIVNGNSCPLVSLDQIEKPAKRGKERALEAPAAQPAPKPAT
ncbi:MAG: hypothetical protein KJS97_15890 [Alphaproteobacteria bacterium]|nr:hypothetical protein [Alphaproteobacteria bacterium]